jgi:D-glycero-D-manno-heptose 1,7-bisphosphate phosphatase
VLNNAIFLDRDGTINKEVDYLTEPEQIVFIDGAKKALRIFRELGYLNIIITNQSAIARGYLTEKKLEKIHAEFLRLSMHNSKSLINDIFYCPYHKKGVVKRYAYDSFFRKPNPGLILKASIKYNIDLNKSFFIGDSYPDMKCAYNAGLKKILVLTGYGEDTLLRCTKEKMKIDCIVNDLFEASKFIKKYLEY